MIYSLKKKYKLNPIKWFLGLGPVFIMIKKACSIIYKFKTIKAHLADMQKGVEVVPTVNMNIYIQNYTNINNFDLKSFINKEFEKEHAKTGVKIRRVETPPELKSIDMPKSHQSLGQEEPVETNENTEEYQVKPMISVRKQSELYERRSEPFVDNNVTQTIGFALLSFSALLFIGVFYSILIAPFVGDSTHVLLDFVKDDIYYCCLVPFMIPTAFVFAYSNWVSIKFFRHT